MSRIVAAINSMIISEANISHIMRGHDETELFFMYATKYKWSIMKAPNETYSLHYYPGSQTA